MSGGRGHRARTIIVCVAVLAGLCLATTPGRAGPRPKGCAVPIATVGSAKWKRLAFPEFPEPPANANVLSAYIPANLFALDPTDPASMLVSNGQFVLASTDAGCTWHEVFSVYDHGPTYSGHAGTPIKSIRVVTTPQGPRVYMPLDYGNGVPLFARSDDFGDSWSVGQMELRVAPGSESGDGVVLGFPMKLTVAPSDPSTIYLPVRTSSYTPADQQLYVSDDGGTTWESRAEYHIAFEYGWRVVNADTSCTPSEAACMGIPFDQLTADPLEADSVWSAGENGIYRSGDGGATWEKRGEIDWSSIGPLWDMDVWHAPGRPAQVALIGSNFMALSVDAGQTWSTVDLLQPEGTTWVTGASATNRWRTGSIVAEFKYQDSVHNQKAYVYASGSWTDITPPGLIPGPDGDQLTLAASDLSKKPAHYFVLEDKPDYYADRQAWLLILNLGRNP